MRLMRPLSTFVGALLLAFSAYGQIDREDRGLSLSDDSLRLGVKAGINRSSPAGDLENPGNAIKPRITAVAEVALSEKLFIQPELSIYQHQIKGDIAEEVTLNRFLLGQTTTASGNVNENTTLSYLSLSGLAKGTVVKTNGFRVSILAGVYLSFLADQQSNSDGVYQVGFVSNDANAKSDYQSLDLGGEGGLALAYEVGPGSVTLDIRASVGLLDVYQNSTVKGQGRTTENKEVGSGIAIRNQTLPSIMVGYLYNL